MNLMSITLRLAITGLLLVSVSACWEAPPMDSEQIGYRGTGMLQTTNPEDTEVLQSLNVVPEPLTAVPSAGPKASDVWENVQVLGDLSVGEFTRTMTAITQWVSPEQGCNYCHNPENLASDDLYTKVVSRRMMQMTKEINSTWSSHVGDTGVTCLTCHRGKNVPEYLWFEQDGPATAKGFAAKGYQQNHAAMNVGTTSMLSDPFSKYLGDDQETIRVVAQNALPYKGVESTSTTQATENTYSLMIHMSDSLGVNCTACHNTRSFTSWNESPPARVTAWHGLQMVPALNRDYLEPLGGTYPEHRLGPKGDAPKVSCMTCHQGVNKPFYGESMLGDYPEWKGTLTASD